MWERIRKEPQEEVTAHWATTVSVMSRRTTQTSWGTFWLWQPSPSDQTTPLPHGQHTGRGRSGWLIPVYHKDSSSSQLFLLCFFNLFKCRGRKIIFPLPFYVLGWDLSLLLLLLLSHFSRVQLCETPGMAAHQASPSLGFSRQEHWSGLPLPSPMHESEKGKWSHSVVSDS